MPHIPEPSLLLSTFMLNLVALMAIEYLRNHRWEWRKQNQEAQHPVPGEQDRHNRDQLHTLGANRHHTPENLVRPVRTLAAGSLQFVVELRIFKVLDL